MLCLFPNRYTFVDLAQIVCKLPVTFPERVELSSDDEYFEGYASEPSILPTNSVLRKMRTGGSLSLSENEYEDSEDEIEMPTPFRIRSGTGSSIRDSTPKKFLKEI